MKKIILVGMQNDNNAWRFMRIVLTTLRTRSIDIVYQWHSAPCFETRHTRVRFLSPESLLRWAGEMMDGDIRVRADGIFGDPSSKLLSCAKPDAVIADRDHIGLVDYICQVEREAAIAEDLRPKTYITTAGDQYDEFRKRMLNYTYGKFGLGGHTNGHYFVDLNGRKPEKVEFLLGRRNGKTQACLKYLENEFRKNVEKEIVYGGENNMPNEAATYVRQDINSLAAAFKRVNDAFNRKLPGIKNVIFSGPCTIVLWEDGTKTVVRCNNDVLDPEKGLAMAIAKKALGTNKSGSNYYDIFKKWLPKEEEPLVLDYATTAKEMPVEEADATCQE